MFYVINRTQYKVQTMEDQQGHLAGENYERPCPQFKTIE